MGKRVFHGFLMLLCFVLPVTAINGLEKTTRTVALPYTFPDTELKLTRLVLHRNGEEGRLGLIAQNFGDRYLSYISVKLNTDCGVFCFETSYLPPGASAVLWSESPMEIIPKILDISGEVLSAYSPFLSEGEVAISESEEGLWIENKTESSISSLWVYYAEYDEIRALYWDKVYITAVSGLRPGEKRYLPVGQKGEYPLRIIGCR